MECFRIAVCGDTGSDLLDLKQQFQSASAIAINDDDAGKLTKEYFPNLPLFELKYSELAKRSENKARLIALQRDILNEFKCVTYVCHKRYLLLLALVDYAVAPFYQAVGIDFYENGRNYALASLLHYSGSKFFGEVEFTALETAFKYALTQKTTEALIALVTAARAINHAALPEIMTPLAVAAPECLRAITTAKEIPDSTLVALHQLVNRLEVMSDAPYVIEHDDSNNMLNISHHLTRLMEHSTDTEFPASRGSMIDLPLKLKSSRQVGKESTPAIQLAKLLAGATNEAMNLLLETEKRDEALSLIDLYAENQLISLLPSWSFKGQRSF